MGLQAPELSSSGWPLPSKVSTTWAPNDDRLWRRFGTIKLESVVPADIGSVKVSVPGEVAALTAEADAALSRLDLELTSASPHIVDAASAHLIRAEGLSSSRIEGLEVSARRLAEADFRPIDAKRIAREVSANVRAMRAALDLGSRRQPMTSTDLLDLHAILMAGILGVSPGQLRDVQNWIGPSNTPTDAIYVPPPPTEIERLIADLVTFANRSDLSPTMHAAIAHAQFEGIHPFVDGNGRVGRCLIGVVIRKRIGITMFPPVSASIRKDIPGYVTDLQAYQLHANPWPWVQRFSHAVLVACSATRRLITDVESLQQRWLDRAGNPRGGSITARIVGSLPAHTITDAQHIVELLKVDPSTARKGLAALEAVGILRQVTVGKRNRVWQATEMHDLLDALS